MNQLIRLSVAIIFISAQPGVFSSSAIAADDEKEALYWVAPMDPNYQRDKPGKSPMGMDLIPVYADGSDDGGSSVTISPEVVQNLGVRTAKAERTRLWRGIDTVGYVDYDESRVSHIHLRTAGWIERLMVESEGERVKKGQLLFEVYSPELVNAQQEFVQAAKAGNKSLLRASKDRLMALGVAKEQINQLQKNHRINQTVGFYAPQDGVVSTLPVREGMYVKPAMRIMSLGDLSSVWLLAEVFERQAAWVAVGQPAEVKLSYLPGKLWEGKVEYIYPSLDPKTRALKVRLRFDNADEALKPNMYANVKIFGGPKDDTIVIPLEALIRTGRNQRVIVDLGAGRFEAREVVAGIESGDWVEILRGLEASEPVVVSGQFLIDSEASMRASLMRMSKPSAPGADSVTTVAEESKVVSATGIVKQLMHEENKLNLQHQAIEALGWPQMTMDFVLSEGVDVTGLALEDEVMFKLEQQNDRYVITEIHKLGQEGM